MALKPLNAKEPIGVFDMLDTEATSLLGGEVVSFTSLTIATSSDLDAADVKDGYSNVGNNKERPAVTHTLVSGMRPLFLADEGISGYGTLFGRVVGSTAGQVVVGGAVLGPHTTSGSGKCTLWNYPGLYAVSLDAVDMTVSTGLVEGNTNLQAGTALYATTAGKLTPNSGAAFEAIVVARFMEFTTNGSLVTTPQSLVSALNSPSGDVQSLRGTFSFAMIVFGVET